MGGRETQLEAEGRERLEDEITQMISGVVQKKDDDSSSSRRAFVKLSTRSPKDVRHQRLDVANGGEAMDLLCRSQRIFHDLGMVEQYATSDSALSIVVREYDDRIRREWEFRCVVQQSRLCSISQYHCYEVLDALQNEEKTHLLDQVARAIVEVHDNHLAPKLASLYQNYVIDFAAIVDEEQKKVLDVTVIEINPSASSGIGLFKWSQLPDKLTLRYVKN